MALERFDERLVFEKVKAEYARLSREKGLPVPKPQPVAEVPSWVKPFSSPEPPASPAVA